MTIILSTTLSSTRPVIIQIVELRGNEPPSAPVVFDGAGKELCRQYFTKLFNIIIRSWNWGYYKDRQFRSSETEAYTYTETFLKLEGNRLIPVSKFEECDFYECHFFTANGDKEDMDVVPHYSYSVVNSGEFLSPA